jgi:hypothetical protein
MALNQHKTTIWSAIIGALALVAAAVITGVLGWGPDWYNSFFGTASQASTRSLTVVLPNDGDLPHGNIDFTIPDATPKADQTLWAAIKNHKDSNWYLYPCTADHSGKGTCKDVTIGANRDAPGPWTIAALIVGEDGQGKILKGNSHHNGSLTDWLGKDLIAIGSADGYRTALPTPSSTS